jgi:hypothetical protein
LKKYYRITELIASFSFSQSDIDYLAFESDIQFCVFCKTTNVIVGCWRKGKFIGYGKASYNGLISITSAQKATLFEKRKLGLRQSSILQKEKILGYQTSYPFKITPPNTVIEEWKATAFEDIDWAQLPFLFYPEERQSNLKLFEGFVKQMSVIDPLNPAEKHSGDNALESFIKVKKELFFHNKFFNLDDVCILADEVIKAQKFMGLTGEVLIDSTQNGLTPSNVQEYVKTRTDDFNDLLIEIIKAHPEYTAKQYWRIFEDESSEIEGGRVFDKNNLIRSISESEAIEWVDKKAKPRKSISMGAFSNRVSRMKKLIF